MQDRFNSAVLQSADPCFSFPRTFLNLESYFEDMEGVDRDMHGAHMITTSGFDNYHVSHVELFNVGQPRLARYPIHWHHAGYVGALGGYADPSSVESLSIHDSFR